jgi:L-asparaginase
MSSAWNTGTTFFVVGGIALMDIQKKIVVINTGGTIAMALDESTDSVKTGGNQPLHSAEPLLKQYAEIEMIDLFNVPSPYMTPDMMRELSKVVDSWLNREEISGIVITHGTDTLEETAYFLDLTVQSDKPVVVTGAMRSSNELGADGPVNLIQSVRVAANENSYGRGTLVVFNDEIHSARDVTKTHTSNVATFQSPAYGPVGVVTKRAVTFHQPAARLEKYIVSATSLPQVPLVKAVSGMDPAWLDFLTNTSIDGFVLEAFGAGNIPPSIIPVLDTLIAKKLPVVMVSRCYNGYVQDLYGYEGGGKQLRQMGVIFCNGLNGQKARIKLIVLLAADVNLETLDHLF